IELCYAAPHMPNEAPEAAIAEYDDIPDKNRRRHAAMVSEVDRGIQKIYGALKKAEILDNTIIWVTSDNGGQSYVGSPESVKKTLKQFTGIWGRPLPFPFLDFIRDNVENGASDNRPLKGGKNTAYEGGVRVPAFIYAPGLLSQQKIEARLTVNDILPTLADASNFKNFDTTNVDGLSQWAFLKQQAKAPEPPYVTASRYMQAYYKEEWKLIIPKEGEAQLYKIKEDPEEKNNLARQHPAIVADLRAALEAFPRGEPVDDSIWKVFFDPDLFGGKEDREPFAGLEGNVKGPLHYSFYVAGFILLLVLGLGIWILRLFFKRFLKRKKG
ncbi:MAG: sulfatase-like hydrolase/transferase, partial [Bacteroidota bacterium]